MAKEPEPITQDELIAELERLSTLKLSSAGGLSTQELVVRLQLTEEGVRKRLRQAVKAGLVDVSRKVATTISGTRCTVPVYRLREVPAPAKPARKPRKRASDR